MSRYEDEDGPVYLQVPYVALRSGQRWSPNETAYLQKAVHRGGSISRICDLLGRPYAGVLGQLQRMRYVFWMPRSYSYEWNLRKVRRKDPIPRERAPCIRIDKKRAARLYQLCKIIGRNT